MNIDKYTERARGFIQSAQSLALREGHQQFAPEHLLKVLLGDEEGLAAGLIDKAGGRSREALVQTELALGKLPKVQGSGAGQLYLSPTTARIFDAAEQLAQKAGDSYVTVERLLLAIAAEKSSDAGKIFAAAILSRAQRFDRSRLTWASKTHPCVCWSDRPHAPSCGKFCAHESGACNARGGFQRREGRCARQDADAPADNQAAGPRRVALRTGAAGRPRDPE